MGERFDRIRPPRAGRGRDEREELFSAGGAGAGRGSALDCSRCGASSALDAGVALRAAIPLFLVVPWREYPIFALCPACERRAWLRIRPAGGR
jgi:hypothetical protein